MRYKASIALSGLLMATTTALADDLNALKGVKMVNYHVWVERVLPDEDDNKNDKRCVADWPTIRTNTDFVAKQSTTLKFVGYEHSDETKRLYAKAPVTIPAIPDYDKLSDEADRYNFMPTMTVSIFSVAVGDWCVATIEVEVVAALKGSPKLWHTDREIYGYPRMKLWSTTSWWEGPQALHTQRVSGLAEKAMKDFVIAWSKAQELK